MLSEHHRSLFWKKIDKREPHECWLWTGGQSGTKRYGKFSVQQDGRVVNYQSHRIAYQETVGPIADGLCVCHRCDTPLCCNPSHLFLGTHQENMADCKRKGRYGSGERSGAKKHPECIPRGENRWCAKLTDSDVAEIRRRASAGEKIKDIAQDFPVSRATVGLIAHGRLWRHIAARPIAGDLRHKLTPEKVKAIRERAQREQQKDLALAFGVSKATISMVVNARLWRHIA